MPRYKYVDGVKYRVVPQSVLGYALVREDSDNSLPEGGTEGQVLSKASNTDYDVEWSTVPNSLPTGGTEGQVLAKSSSTDYDVEWSTVESGGGDKVYVCVPVYDEQTETITFTETWSEIKSYLDNGYIVCVRISSANQTILEYGSLVKYNSDTGIYSFSTIKFNGLSVTSTTYTTDSADGYPEIVD